MSLRLKVFPFFSRASPLRELRVKPSSVKFHAKQAKKREVREGFCTLIKPAKNCTSTQSFCGFPCYQIPSFLAHADCMPEQR